MSISRRDFIKLSGAALLTTHCAQNAVAPDPDAPDGGSTPETDAARALDGGHDAGIEPLADAGETPGECTSDAPSPDEPTEDVELGSIPLNAAMFPLGVMAGDVLSDRAMVWTRYDGDRPLAVRI